MGVLISFGAVLGKVNSFQLLTMATIEVIFYGMNVGLGQKELHAVDMGGSMYVHTFGAYFGLACSWMLGPKKIADNNPNIGASYNSNLFAAIGTVFLWMFWPSFNGALATGNSQHRVVVNTVLALSASTMGAYFVSAMLNRGLFKMEDCLNATLTGGVIIGSIAAAAASTTVYGDQLSEIFPELEKGRSQGSQGGYQMLCLFSTLSISIVSGLLTGMIIRAPFFMGPKPEDCFDDEKWWQVEDSEIAIDKKVYQLESTGRQKLD